MKKFCFLILTITVGLSLLTACTPSTSESSSAPESVSKTEASGPGKESAEPTAGSGEFGIETTAPAAASSSAAAANPTDQASAAKTSPVFRPDELLTAEEASGIVGQDVKLDDGSLYTDPESGLISERYVYDLTGEGNTSTTTVHALVEIYQNGLLPAAALKEGHNAKWLFNTEKEFSADEITSLSGLGQDAFYFNTTCQVHVLFGDYYIVAAFDKDPYDSSLSLPLNLAIATHITDEISLAGVSFVK